MSHLAPDVSKILHRQPWYYKTTLQFRTHVNGQKGFYLCSEIGKIVPPLVKEFHSWLKVRQCIVFLSLFLK